MCDDFKSFSSKCEHREGTRCTESVEMARKDWQEWPICCENECPYSDKIMLESDKTQAIIRACLTETVTNPRTTKEFNVFKGNCVNREVVDGVECCSHDDEQWLDCDIEWCPRLPTRSYPPNEGPISQCPLCGCETDAAEVDEGIERYRCTNTRMWCGGAVIGIFAGVALCLLAQYAI